MSPKLLFQQKRQYGSALVLAIFIIVVMSVLGAALIRMPSSSATSVAYEVIGTRAFLAAQVGIQRQLQQMFPLNGAAVDCQALPPISFSSVAGLENCDVSNVCAIPFEHDTIKYNTITSTGQCDINGEKVSRTIEVEARSL